MGHRVLGLVVFSDLSKGKSYLPMLPVEETEREKHEKVRWIAKPSSSAQRPLEQL